MENFKSITELNKNLDITIEKNLDNMTLIKKITKDFIKKGLSVNTPMLLFEKGLEVENLNEYEKICLTKSLYDNLKIYNLNPKLYFSARDLDGYELLVIAKENNNNKVVFKNALKLTDTSYVTYIKPKEILELFQNRQLGYYYELQRPAREVKLGRTIVKKMSLNKQSVEEIKNECLSDNKNEIPVPTTISLTLLYTGNNKLNFSFIGDKYGEIIIEPNFNKNDKDYTPLLLNDGNHRLQAYSKAYIQALKENKNFDEPLIVAINILNIERAKKLVINSLKVNLPKEEELKTINPNSENKFVDKLINKSNILKGNVVNNFNNIKGTNNIVSRNILLDSIKLCNIDLSDNLEIELQSSKYAEYLDLITGRIEKILFSNKKEFLKSVFAYPYMFTGYIACCDIIVNNNYDTDKILNIINIIINNKEHIEELNLNYKKTNIEKTFEEFKRLIGVE